MSEKERVGMDAYEAAAQHLLEADYILVAAGAGFSADSGLPVYADVASHPLYASRGKDYADLANVDLLMEEPNLFWHFWGSCRAAYDACLPHSGYRLLNSWFQELPKMSRLDPAINPWYVYTSNVDGHFRRFDCLNSNLCEMHGCVEESVCSSSLCYYVDRGSGDTVENCKTKKRLFSSAMTDWNARCDDPQRMSCRGTIMKTPLFPDLSDISMSSEDSLGAVPIPKCTNCNVYELRPLVVMFGDSCPNIMPHIWKSTDRYQLWENSMEVDVCKHGKKLVVLELGCGTRVPSVRQEVSEVVLDICNNYIPAENDNSINDTPPGVVLIRVNSFAGDALVHPDILEVSSNSVSISDRCEDALQRIDEYIKAMLINL